MDVSCQWSGENAKSQKRAQGLCKSRLCFRPKGGAIDSGQRPLIFELHSWTNTQLPSVLRQKLRPPNSQMRVTKVSTLPARPSIVQCVMSAEMLFCSLRSFGVVMRVTVALKWNLRSLSVTQKQPLPWLCSPERIFTLFRAWCACEEAVAADK